MTTSHKNAHALALGSKKAELAAAIKTGEILKAELTACQKQLKAGWKSIAARLKKMDVDLPLNEDGEPTAAALERAMAEAEGYAIKARQLAEQQVLACGFDPDAKAKLDELNKALSSSFKPKP